MRKAECFSYFALFVAALGGLLFGFHTAIISGALIFIAPVFHLSVADQGFLVSIILVGAIAGALFAGDLADRVGRRLTIAIASLFFIIGTGLTSFAEGYSLLLSGRFIAGLGLGITSVASPLYIAETSPAKRRGSFVSCYQLAISLGILIAFTINLGFAKSADWRGMFLCGAIPAVMQFAFIFLLPETPSWLFRQGREAHAKEAFCKMGTTREWEAHLQEMQSVASPKRKGDWKLIFKKNLRFVVLIGLFLSIAQQITGINTVIYFAPKIFQTAGFTSAMGALFATLGIGIVNAIATIFSVWLMDKWGRRPLLLTGIAGMAISLICLALAFWIGAARIDIIAIVSLMAFVCSFAISLGPVTWVLLSEIYPLKVRGRAMTLATFGNWVFNYLVSLTFLDLISGLGSAGTFALYGAISCLAFFFVYRWIPETKGKRLEEIEALLIK